MTENDMLWNMIKIVVKQSKFMTSPEIYNH